MIPSRVAGSFGIGAFLVLFVCGSISADIYRYKDENGVWHFTNVKSDKQYKLFMRTRTYGKSPSKYIKDYEWVIKEASNRFRIEPSLIKAVIKAESDFDQKAVSRKGAQGLMQLMPDTANDMKVQDPFNPEENIFGGTRYLSLMLERFNNNKRLALAAYNAGPESVEEFQGIPPYPETRSFIKKVLYYYNQYSSGER